METGKPTFRVAIGGTRTFCNYQELKKSCDIILANKTQTHRISVVSAANRGADTLGHAYALEMGYRVEVMDAFWDKEGKSAGFNQKRRLAQSVDAAILFWDGKSEGTKFLLQELIAAKKSVRIVEIDPVHQAVLRMMSTKEVNLGQP